MQRYLVIQATENLRERMKREYLAIGIHSAWAWLPRQLYLLTHFDFNGRVATLDVAMIVEVQ